MEFDLGAPEFDAMLVNESHGAHHVVAPHALDLAEADVTPRAASLRRRPHVD